MKKFSIPIQGMHCRSCELLVQDELVKIPGIISVQVNSRSASALIEAKKLPSHYELERAVQCAGYQLGKSHLPWVNSDVQVWVRAITTLILLSLVILLMNKLELFNFMSSSVVQPTSLSAILLLGLTAGFSTCTALVVGLLLTLTTTYSQARSHTASWLERLEPAVFFQVGRIVGFMVFGALLGVLGSSIQPTPFLTALLSGLTAVVMIWFGLQLTGLFPRFTTYQFTLPSWIASKLGLVPSMQTVYSPIYAILLGALTFFVPCGFTQVVQLYAISTASLIDAGVVMGLFALATVPGLTAVGVLGSFSHKSKTIILTQFIGIVIILFGLYSLVSARNLAVAGLPSNQVNKARSGQSDLVDVQVIEMTQKSYGYSPKTFTVKKGKPVRWIIDSQDQYSCASSILLAKYGINTTLKPGKNVFEFTPEETGRLNFSCSMGMYTGTIQVIE